jgi:putative transposase
MPRQPRFRLVGFPQHIVQRGNNRQTTFRTESDFRVFKHYLAEASTLHRCAIHAYCVMTNHVHLLVTPASSDAVSKTLHAVSQRYASHFNRVYERSGTLWDGRYRATLVDTDAYVLTCYRYIELNPVRAQMVALPEQYLHSSFRHNGLGEDDPLISEHSVYAGLLRTEAGRQELYRELLSQELTEPQLAAIRQATSSESVLGSDAFKRDVEERLQRLIERPRVGRPRRNS